MTYEQAVEYIYSIPKFTKKNKPEHTKEFLRYLGNPQEKLKVIHVAGTNGKGSVCSCLETMLRAEGKSVGLAMSPHLVKINERIVIQGEAVSDETFLEIFHKVSEKVGVMEKQGLPHPTFFEFLFGMAVLAFAEAGVEYAVLETGLGGRLDATNCVEHPLCSVIASIGMDHMQYLGNTIEEIAAEKAGILKKGVPAFFSEGQEASNQVIEKRAEELGIFCKKIRKNAFEILETGEKHIAFSCVNAYYEGITWKLHNTGIYQAENTMLALEVMRELFGEEGNPSVWRDALEQRVWAGRMEEVLPGIYVDGAHNVNAIERFAESVSGDNSREKNSRKKCSRKAEGSADVTEHVTEHVSEGQQGIGILFSAVEDKDYEEMIASLCQGVDAEFYVVTHIEDARAADTQKLADTFRRYTQKPVVVRESLRDAWNWVLENKGDRRVYCLGSLYLVGMVKDMIQEDS